MRAPIFARGSPTVNVSSYIPQLPVGHARTHPSKGTPKGSRDVWWHHFRWKGPTRANIVQLPVAHARTPLFQWSPFGITWRLMTSNPVAMLLPIMRNGTFFTTTIVRKKRGNWLYMRMRSLPVTYGSDRMTSGSGHVTTDDVTSGSSTSLHLKYDFSCPYLLLVLQSNICRDKSMNCRSLIKT